MKPPTWSQLRWLGDSRVLRSSFVWLVAVPLIVKGAAALPSGIADAFTPFPFSWGAFYFASLFTAIGNLIYLLRCPTIVRSYDSYAEFQSQGKGIEQLRRELETTCLKFHTSIAAGSLAQTLREFSTSFCDPALTPDEIARIEEDSSNSFALASTLNIKPEQASQAFWALRDFADQLVQRWRWPCLISFAIGLSLIGWVFLENVYKVSTTLLEGWKEKPMAMQQPAPQQPAPKYVWLEFDGAAELEETGHSLLLRPKLDPRIALRFSASDVQTSDPVPMIRQGAVCQSIEVPDDSPLNAETNESPPGMGRCEGNPTMCIGGIELCCHNRKAVGKCVGYWRCP